MLADEGQAKPHLLLQHPPRLGPKGADVAQMLPVPLQRRAHEHVRNPSVALLARDAEGPHRVGEGQGFGNGERLDGRHQYVQDGLLTDPGPDVVDENGAQLVQIVSEPDERGAERVPAREVLELGAPLVPLVEDEKVGSEAPCPDCAARSCFGGTGARAEESSRLAS